ncbi:MAG: type 4a pilus biogenesis protein PilO [Pseudomonadales bacterium]
MALSDSLKSLNEININDLSFDNIGAWPLLVKMLAWLAVFLLILVGGYYGLIEAQQLELDKVEKRELVLRKKFARTAHEAANLEDYRKQLKEMEETFGVLLGQLPNKTEVPGLLDDITDTGIRNGLSYNRIALKKEKRHEFFVELPIDVSLGGTYHDFGAFVSGVAALPRIVTLHDFKITRQKGKGGPLKLDIVAKTYRYKE